MVLPPGVQDERGPGVIDFQDALRGPIGYDLVSLLKDCYISWSRERVERWVKTLVLVRSASGFGDQPAVANGYSDAIAELWGEPS